MTDPVQLDAILRGVAVGGFSVLGMSMALAPRSLVIRLVGSFFFLAAIGHTLDNSVALQGPDGHAGIVLRILSIVASAMFWLFALMIFGDERRMPLWRVVPPTLVSAVALVAISSPSAVAGPVFLAYNIGTVLLVAHALVAIWRGLQGDLVEPRRRLRGPVMAAAGIYVLIQAAHDIGANLGLQSGAPVQLQAIMLASLALLGALALLRMDPVLLGPAIEVPTAQGRFTTLDLVDQATLAKLTKAMDEDEIWRREDLSIRVLADHLVTTEHRLRRLINGALGHRNFAAFINAARIEAAKRSLRDPEQALRSIAVIAYDLGFGSLGPFNRAFRESAGVTPKAWRQGQSAQDVAETR